MSDEQKLNYLNARKEYAAALAQLGEITNPVFDAANKIARHWDVQFGPDANKYMVSGPPMVDLSKWPTAEQLVQAVENCRQKRGAMKELWGYMSGRLQSPALSFPEVYSPHDASNCPYQSW